MAASRNDAWRDDLALKENLEMYVRQGMQRKEILDFLKRDFPMYAWSIPTLDRRLRHFHIFYSDKNVTLHEVKEAVGKNLRDLANFLVIEHYTKNPARAPFERSERSGICSYAGTGS